MSQHGVIKRYSLIIKKISEAFYPNFASIKAYLAEKGFEVSKRTIQRDIVQIDNEFGLKISFDKRKNGYFISEKDKIQLEPFIKFLGIFRHAELLRDSLAKSRETLNFVKFETGENLSGIEFLEPTLEALRENRIVKMSYQTSWSGPLKDFSIHPYLLKQYLNRWYIVGCYPNKNKLYIFGLDRIKKLELTDCFFLPDPEINALDRFENIVGLVKNDTELEKVVLVFEASQANYIKSLPIHKSQKVVRETKSSCIVELELVPNLEFIQTILMHGSFVKVREPLWLVEEIKETLKEALAQYSS